MITESETETITQQALARALKDEVFRAAESIGEGYDGYCANRTPAELKAYAEGVHGTLIILAERHEIKLRTGNIRAAVGEALRRRGAPEQKLKSRRLNNLVEQIRDHRIAILDHYAGYDYPKAREWQKKLWAIERDRREEEWEDFETVQRELRALSELHDHLLGDEGWRQHHFEVMAQRQAAGKEAA